MFNLINRPQFGSSFVYTGREMTEQTLEQNLKRCFPLRGGDPDRKNCLTWHELGFALCSSSSEIGPASVMVGNLVSGKRIAQASGRDLGQIEDNDQARKVCVSGGSVGFLHHHKRHTHTSFYVSPIMACSCGSLLWFSSHIFID